MSSVDFADLDYGSYREIMNQEFRIMLKQLDELQKMIDERKKNDRSESSTPD